jgi:hypothetical protein
MKSTLSLYLDVFWCPEHASVLFLFPASVQNTFFPTTSYSGVQNTTSCLGFFKFSPRSECPDTSLPTTTRSVLVSRHLLFDPTDCLLDLFSLSSPNLHTENGQPKESLDFPTSKACWEDFDLQINAFTAHHDRRNVRLSHLESLLIDACSGAQNTLRFGSLMDLLMHSSLTRTSTCSGVQNTCQIIVWFFSHRRRISLGLLSPCSECHICKFFHANQLGRGSNHWQVQCYIPIGRYLNMKYVRISAA